MTDRNVDESAIDPNALSVQTYTSFSLPEIRDLSVPPLAQLLASKPRGLTIQILREAVLAVIPGSAVDTPAPVAYRTPHHPLPVVESWLS